MKRGTQNHYEQAVLAALAHVWAGLDGALDLQALARKAGLSPFHFHRIFKGMVGETPLEMHRRLRLERAALALLHSNRPVTEIAFCAGYETHESFTRAFKQRFACSPSDFRESAGLPSECTLPVRVGLAARSGLHFSEQTPDFDLCFLKGPTVMDVQVLSMPAKRVAVVQHIGPYNQISEAFHRLGEVAISKQLFGPQSEMLAVYYDDPESTASSELRSEAGLTVSKDQVIPEELIERQLAGGTYARVIHKGSYAQLGDTWARLMGQWLPESGHRVGEGVSYEIYRNTPDQVDEGDLVTEIYVPLAD